MAEIVRYILEFKMIKLHFLVLLLIIIPFFIYAQTPEWINYTAGSEVHRIIQEGNYLWLTGGGINKYNILTGENTNYNKANSGLPDNYVTSIAVDKNGIKWIGTRSSQLARFDGKNWVVFNPTNSPLPPDCGVNDLVVDSNNILWIGLWFGGIIKYDGTNWTIFNQANSGFPSDYTWCITVDQKNNIWAGLTGGLVRYDGNKWIIYDQSNSKLPGVAVSSIKVDLNNTKWIGTQQGGLVSFNDTSWSNTAYGSGSYFDGIDIDKSGTMWMGCINGNDLMKLSNTGSELIPAPAGIMSIFIDDKENKWIGTLTKGLFLLDSKNNWIPKKIGNSEILEDKQKSVFVDKKGNKWVGTDGRGISKFDGKSWTNFSREFGTSISGSVSTISSIREDYLGNIWFGSSGWLGKYDGNKMTLFTRDNSDIPTDPASWLPMIRDIAIDKNGILWIGTWIGLVRFDGHKNWKVYNTSNSKIPENKVESVAIDSIGNIWLGYGNSGVGKLKNEEWVNYPYGKDGPFSANVYGLFIDHGNNLWVGGPCSNISKYDGSKWTHYPSGFNCVSIAEDDKNNMWFGTWDGLVKYDGKSFTNYTTINSGLPCNYVQGISFDQTGNLWIATDGGGLAQFKMKLSQSSNWQADINVKDNGDVLQALTIGQSSVATDGIDNSLGEAPLPPPPFGFDARFILPTGDQSWTDFRSANNNKIEWSIKFQPGLSGYPVTFSWDKTKLPEGGFTLKDKITGSFVNVDMRSANFYTLTNDGINSLKITYEKNVIRVPDVVIKILPLNASRGIKFPSKLTWHVSLGASRYRLQLSVDNTFKTTLVDAVGLLDTTYSYDGQGLSSTVFWRVKAINDWFESDWSDVWNFTTVVAIPGKPGLIYPIANAKDQSRDITFKWTKVKDTDKYYIQLSKDEMFVQIVNSDSTITDTSKTIAGLNNNTKYYWRIRARNISGYGAWSDVWNFTTVVAIPGKPGLIHPIANAIDQSKDIIFKWTKVKDTDKYYIQLSKDEMFIQIVNSDSTITDTSKTIAGLNNNTKYYWRIRARNISGYGAWSDVWNFTTVVAIPGKPGLIYPIANAKDQSRDITFKWTKVKDADKYYIQLSKDEMFGTVAKNDSTTIDTMKVITNVPEGQKYFWKLRARNIAGISPFSDVWIFTTRITAPSNLTLFRSGLKEITLKWNNNSNGEERYVIERRTALQTIYSSIDTLKIASNIYLDNKVEQGVTYFYRIKAYSQYAQSSYSNEASLIMVDVLDKNEIPTTYSLSQNYPNPFNPTCLIRFGLPEKVYTQLSIFDILGKKVATLVNEEMAPGYHEIRFDAFNLSSGIYFYRLVTPGFNAMKKILLIK